MSESISLEKTSLRTRLLQARAAVSPQQAQIASRMVIMHMLLHIPQSALVAGYSAVRGELDISILMKVLAEKGNRLCLPVVTHKEAPLTFCPWQPGEALMKGSYGIPVPASADAVVPDILLVPLLGFDENGQRLGYGAGYYDRTIPLLRQKNPKLKVIGVGYALQKVAAIPAEPHDVKLDAVVTENGMMKTK